MIRVLVIAAALLVAAPADAVAAHSSHPVMTSLGHKLGHGLHRLGRGLHNLGHGVSHAVHGRHHRRR